MKRKQEIYARELHEELRATFYGKQKSISRLLKKFNIDKNKENVEILIKGSGVHWQCLVTKSGIGCNIDCFDFNMLDIAYKGPEFSTSFLIKEKSIAEGRTFDKVETIAAVKSWIQYKDIHKLYTEFDFIDKNKRKLKKNRVQILAAHPELCKISENEVIEEASSIYGLWFKNDNRSCRMNFCGYEPTPQIFFNWDDSLMFKTSHDDIDREGILIKRWVFDKANPSVLRKEFPDINFGKLADFYEAGNKIEGEFLLSWDDVEEFYNNVNIDSIKGIISFIKELRNRGYDKVFRAGTSLYSLVLSRSKRHGLREDQKSITFSFAYIESKMEVYTLKESILEFEKIEYDGTIEALLKELECEAID